VGDLIARRAVTLAPDASVEDAARLMTSAGLEALAVVEDTEVVGLVSTRELLTVLVRDLERDSRPGLADVLGCVQGRAEEAAVLATALGVARGHRARLRLLHVLGPLPRSVTASLPTEALQRVSATRKGEALEWLRGHVPAREPVAVTCRVAEGELEAEALRAASRDVDLIIVARDVAPRLSRRAPCPVLGVPPGSGRDAGR
jgi:hypothetical protein